MSVKLMSFNVMSCRNYLLEKKHIEKFELDTFAEEILHHNADIIGLNEVRNEGSAKDFQAQAKILAEKLGYYYYFAKAFGVDGVNPYGNAILSRFPILSAQTIIIPDPETPAFSGYYETRCILKAKIDLWDGIEVCVTHFGCNPDEQENAVKTVLTQIKNEKCILMGDFNIFPDNPLLGPIRDRLFDTAALFSQELMSFPSDDPKVKLDYIFTSRDIKVLDADIPADVVSDHRPYIAVITGMEEMVRYETI